MLGNLNEYCTPPKTNMDTQNDGLEKVTPFKHGVIFGIYVRFLGCTPIYKWIKFHPVIQSPLILYNFL